MSFLENIHLLEGPDLLLEALDERHRIDLKKCLLYYPDLLKYSPKMAGNEQEAEAYLNNTYKENRQGKRRTFCIIKKGEGPVGMSSFGAISKHDKRVEIGWTWIIPPFQGSGLNYRVKYLMLQFIFEELKYHRVELKADARNIASRKAMEKLGATYEGNLRSHTLMYDGNYRDTVYYSILENEWPEIKRDLEEKYF